jgi:hypothetical protein
MTRQETATIMDILAAAYPRFYTGPDAPNPVQTLSLWATMFADDPVEVVAMAVKAFIASDKKGFPPHIGAIKDAIVKLNTPDAMTEQEAWELVRRATSNSNYGAKDEFEKLPPVVRRLVGSPNQLREWAMMDSDTLNSVVASNFQRSYKARAASEREYMALPSDVRNAMDRLSGSMRMPELGEGVTNERRNEQLRRLIGE